MGSHIGIKDIPEVARFIGMGYYKVKESGEFLEADETARELFGLPQEETDLSKYSIIDLYIFPAERKLRIDKLKETGGGPISRSLSIRVKDENRLLFEQSWYETGKDREIYVIGLVANIRDWIIFPKMFEDFPMGVYQLDDDNKIVHFNKKALEIFGYNEEQKNALLYRNIGEFYVNPEDLKRFSDRVSWDGHAHEILKFKNAQAKIIEVECFTSHINEFKKASWGMLYDVTKRERYYRALDNMPTGYFYIKYDKQEKHSGKIVQCNEQFAKILGVDDKNALIGLDERKFYASKEEGEEYYKRLDAADAKDEPVLNYPFMIKRADRGEIAHIEIDAHLIKENGKVIGREGTIRDISEKVELQTKVKETEKRLQDLTADINKLLHTFLHPVLKFSGHAELFQQLGKILFRSIRFKSPGKIHLRQLGEELENKLIGIQRGLYNISENSESAFVLGPKFEQIANIFDYNLNKAKGSNILMDKAIRDTALWVLEELERADFFIETIKREKVHEIITTEFVQYLQDILFDYLIRTAHILQGETLVMRREVEAMRRYIGFGTRKIDNFRIFNLGKILEENIEVFKPILAQKDLEIDYNPSGSLYATISAHDIDRVICNLLHNAAKYSFAGPGRVIRIKTRDLQQENAVEFIISSYGIPIKKREIENGDIWKFGYRGQLAFQADRDGTGIGLADAKDVIEQHQGSISITSETMKDDGNPPQYKAPYITTVTVRLPKTRGEQKNENQ